MGMPHRLPFGRTMQRRRPVGGCDAAEGCAEADGSERVSVVFTASYRVAPAVTSAGDTPWRCANRAIATASAMLVDVRTTSLSPLGAVRRTGMGSGTTRP